MYTPVIIFIAGLAIGAIAVYFLMRAWMKDKLNSLKGDFADLSLNVLGKVTHELSKQNQQALTHERTLSAVELQKVTKTVENMVSVVRDFEKDRINKFGELAKALNVTHSDHEALAKLTHELHSVIYQKQTRGQWGERMAEDILRLAGFQEGVNYISQNTLSTSGNRPDFTFILPKDLTLNMDVKFPLENYSRYVNAETEAEKSQHMKQFLVDVKGHIKRLSGKEYISHSENTLNYVVMFIPSDLIYTAIFQIQPMILDDALKDRVILCSPSTLYAILGVIRQAVDNFALERSTGEIIYLMETFLNEWNNYCEKIDSFGKKIDSLQKEYGELIGARTQKLEKPLRQFKALLHNKNND